MEQKLHLGERRNRGKKSTSLYEVELGRLQNPLTKHFVLLPGLGRWPERPNFARFSLNLSLPTSHIQVVYALRSVWHAILVRWKWTFSPSHMLIVQRPERYIVSFMKYSLCFFPLNAVSVPLLLDPEDKACPNRRDQAGGLPWSILRRAISKRE